MSHNPCQIVKVSQCGENQCTEVNSCSSSTSSEECSDSFANKIALTLKEDPFQSGDINIEKSREVHLGQKNVYENCHFRIVQYLNDVSEISTIQKDTSKTENKTDNHQKNSSYIENKFKLWIRKNLRQVTIIFGVFLLLIIVSVLLAIFLNAVLPTTESETPSSIIETNTPNYETTSTIIQTTTSKYETTSSITNTTTPNYEKTSSTTPGFENISTSSFPTTTNAPKSNQCPVDHRLSVRRIDLVSDLAAQQMITHDEAYKITSREEWNASVYEYEPIKLENPEYVIVSHTLQDRCWSEIDCIERVQTLQKFDRTIRKLDDIRYNFLIGGNGDVFEGRGWDVAGQHTENYNNRSLGIAFIMDSNEFLCSLDQKLSFDILLRKCVRNKKLREDFKLIGRCQVVFSTNSPGRRVYQLIQMFKQWTKDPLVF